MSWRQSFHASVRSALPKGAVTKNMFGGLAAFVNDNMFGGLFARSMWETAAARSAAAPAVARRR